jgi:hypothetical protein
VAYSFIGEGYNNTFDRVAFLVGKTSVRQLSVPAPLRAILDQIEIGNPYVNDIYDSVGLSLTWLSESTPKIYEVLNKISRFVPDSEIIQYPHGSRLVVNDWRIGFRSPTQPGDSSLRFANWAGDPDDIDINRPDLLTAIPDSTIVLPQGWWAQPFDVPADDRNLILGYDQTIAWNWDDPDYCRAMCLALGFSEADLTP